jgi:tetratricopeptide (TPR) repeat protein
MGPGEMEPRARQAELGSVGALLVQHLVATGNLVRAVTLADEILAALDSPASKGDRARIAIWRGWALERLGRYAEARTAFEAAEAVLGGTGDVLGLMALTGQVGAMLHQEDDPACAEKLRAGLRLCESAPGTAEWERVRSAARRALGNRDTYRGDHGAARKEYERAYDHALTANAPVEIVDALNCLAALHYYGKDLAEAEASWRLALKSAEEWDLLQHRSMLLGNIGEVELARGDAGKAKSTFMRALALQEYLATDRGVTESQRCLAEACLVLGEIGEARTHGEQSLSVAERTGSPYCVGMSHRTLGKVLIAGGEKARGRDHLSEAMRVFEGAKMGKFVEETRALFEE